MLPNGDSPVVLGLNAFFEIGFVVEFFPIRFNVIFIL